MRKTSKRAIAVALIVGGIFVFSFLNEGASQLVYLIGVLLCGALVLKNGLTMAGGAELAVGIGAVFGPACSRVLAESGAAQCLSTFINIVLRFCLDRLDIMGSVEIGPEASVTLTFFVIFALLAAFSSPRTAVEAQKGPADPEFQEKNYVEKSRGFCQFLTQRLRAIDRETDWNDSLFTPLEAEVEVSIRNKRKKKFSDLLKCLKSIRHRGRIFLVLGDPGSGKSVALRKLCSDLLEESVRTKKIPVYVNLKKWSQDWDMNHLPTKEDLIAFIRDTLSEGGDIFTNSFLNMYFDKMLENGRWYFVFDSFDELPCLMGRQSCQELIGKISELLSDFLTGPGQNGGIIASRLYKSPSEALGATVTLKIQKFTDIKIRKMLRKYLNNADKAILDLFGKREDLVVLCRNPFYLALLANYLENNDMCFPKNQMELYSNFVEHRLGECDGKLDAEQLTVEDVHKGAKELAVFMQQSTSYGLECPLSALSGYGKTKDWRKVLRLLEYIKICRFGGEDETASFVHRRFQEFFLVESITENGQTIGRENYQSIIVGSGMRDALVLYCEVAEDEQAREIAHFCWDTIRDNIKQSYKSVWNAGGVELVSALHFMTEAFRNRRRAIEDFRGDFELLVKAYLNSSTDFVIQLALVDSMVLFEQAQLQELVLQVFSLENRWLSDVVVENCRVIKQLSEDLESKFVEYILHMDIRTFTERFWNMRFSLSISKSFRYIRTIHSLLALLEVVMLVATAGVVVIMEVLSIQYTQDAYTTMEKVGGFWKEFIHSETDVVSLTTFLLVIWMVIGESFFIHNLYGLFAYWRILRRRHSQQFVSESSRILIPHTDVLISDKVKQTEQKRPSVKQLFQAFKLPGAYALWYYALFPLSAVNIVSRLFSFAWVQMAIRVITVGLLAAVLAISLPILHHELRKEFKGVTWQKILGTLKEIWILMKRFFRCKDNYVTLLIATLIYALIGIVVVLLVTRGEKIMITFLVIVFATGTLYLLVQGATRSIRYLKDKRWINKQTGTQRLSRERLANELKELSCTKSRRKYVDLLLQQKAELTGSWDDDQRPKYGDDRLDYNLTRLDCAKLDSCNYLF